METFQFSLGFFNEWDLIKPNGLRIFSQFEIKRLNFLYLILFDNF
jgi:hypothetical protein